MDCGDASTSRPVQSERAASLSLFCDTARPLQVFFRLTTIASLGTMAANAAPVQESAWASNDGNPDIDATQPEPVATEPLKRVGTEKELNEETVVDKEAARWREAEEPEKQPDRTPLERTGSTWTTTTGTSIASSEAKSEDVKPEKRSWREVINPFKHKHKPPIPEQRQVSREYGANFFSHMTFQWMAPLMDVSG